MLSGGFQGTLIWSFILEETMNLWKTFALIMIGLLIIVAGIRFTYVETHVFRLNDEQKLFVMNAAQNGLKNETDGKNYNVSTQDRGWIISTAYGDKKVASVVFTNGNTTLAVLVDMNTGDIVKKSMVEYSGWMREYQSQNSKRWGHQRLFNR